MRLLLATDQPFWHCRGGAHQRIACLWQALRHGLAANPTGSLHSLVYYLGDPAEVAESGAGPDWGPIIAVRERSSPFAPTWRWLSSWLGSADNRVPNSSHNRSIPQASAPATSLTLTDYRWNWVEKHWNAVLHEFRPDVVILEYVTMTYLIDLTTTDHRRRIVWAVDTHDCLSERAAQFRDAGQVHWLEIDEVEEIAALNSADLVVAIQESEREWFAARLRQPRVITTGHAPLPDAMSNPVQVEKNHLDEATQHEPSNAEPPPLKIGFLASNNFPNRQGLWSWLQQVAPRLAQCEIIVGGSIGSAVQAFLDSDVDLESVKQVTRCVGRIETLGDFYRHVDVVICPIELGTGLKIKLVEALAFARPVFASRQATDPAMDDDCGVVVCSSADHWIRAINEAAKNREHLHRLQTQAARFAQGNLQPDQVYEPLRRALSELAAKKTTS